MRVTDEKLRTLVTFPADKDSSLFIEIAELVISENLASAGLSEERLDLIAGFIAAHYVQITEGGQVSSKEIGSTKETYAGTFGQGLLSTNFGQTACALDTSGTLSKIATAKPKAQIRVIGCNPSQYASGGYE